MPDHTVPFIPPIYKSREKWEKDNNVLKKGQLGICTDDPSITVGNGISDYSEIEIIKPRTPIDSLESDSTENPPTANQVRRLAREFLSTTIYVDSDSGSNSTGDGTENKPFETLEYALDYAPQNNEVKIQLAFGSYSISKVHKIYNTSFSLYGVKSIIGEYPTIEIDSSIDTSESGIFDLSGQGISEFYNLNFVSSDSSKVEKLISSDSRSTGIKIHDCDFTTFSKPIHIESSSATVNGCSFSDCDSAIYVRYGKITSFSNVSENCMYGFICIGGKVFCQDNLQPIGTYGNSVSAGGKIIGTSGEIYVDSSSGSNYTGTGTESKPFNTLKYAVNLLPTECNGKYSIILNGNFEEDLIDLSNKCISGSIVIKGKDSNNLPTIKCNSEEVLFSCDNTNYGGVNLSISDLLLQSKNTSSVTKVCILGKSLKTFETKDLTVEYFETGVSCESNLGSVMVTNVELNYISNTALFAKNTPLVNFSGISGESINRLIDNDSSIIIKNDYSGTDYTLSDRSSNGGIIFEGGGFSEYSGSMSEMAKAAAVITGAMLYIDEDGDLAQKDE